ncbi:MAG: hypothetical protein IPH68_10870 [Chitinophagaceae bacterium]|nr:hypothetical protein [Chitinophagaceae bacterium]MBK7558571.1 hypothetical protein [Chitinophagaceae bacterium]MBK9530564.1 hypothetical protein [Chitinophagaceae bacterium]HQW93158.1 hypothetical protein [Ferruginibacter sp.]
MNKTTKTTLQFILGGLLFVTIAATSCKSKDSKSETTESSVTPAPTPAQVTDSSNIIDTGDVKPTPDGN